jgi:exonuclease SbcC
MWQLESIFATNICAFKELDYSPQQDCTTLVFGDNLDNESQRSNGSGKSALIEAIAIGLTGEPLRKIKTDEIINDIAEEAYIQLTLTNAVEKRSMMIERTLSRKNPQAIAVSFGDMELNDLQHSAQSSVAEYNKFILDTIGLSKDDLYDNFILCKHKYTPFLMASDKDKKDLINRFSNGALVDKALEHLQVDLDNANTNFTSFGMLVANAEGRLCGINEQLAAAKEQAKEKAAEKEAMIANFQQKIADSRAAMRKENEDITKYQTQISLLDELDNAVSAIEKDTQIGLTEAYQSIKHLFAEFGLREISDYTQALADTQAELTKAEQFIKENEPIAKQFLVDCQEVTEQAQALQQQYSQAFAICQSHRQVVAEKITAFKSRIISLQEQNTQLRGLHKMLTGKIANAEASLAGTIVCPKCQHQFLLNQEKTISELELEIQSNSKQQDKMSTAIQENEQEITGLRESINHVDDDSDALEAKATELKTQLLTLQNKATNYQTENLRLSGLLQAQADMIEVTTAAIANYRATMMNEAYNIIDAEYTNYDSMIANAKQMIEAHEGRIASYNQSIATLNVTSSDNMINILLRSKADAEADLKTLTDSKNTAEKEYNVLKSQEARFIDFKTYLANSKIEALSHVTNEFLQKIGSDIRIVFQGYTKLKSGKVRDKISISLVRDGIDCGSFGKFSEGEKTRANLASVLALHKLCNLNCPDGKGLNLLVLDEILDATDESGLANIFDALNSLKITSLVVSHGLVHENYPHKVIVRKENGISKLTFNAL